MKPLAHMLWKRRVQVQVQDDTAARTIKRALNTPAAERDALASAFVDAYFEQDEPA